MELMFDSEEIIAGKEVEIRLHPKDKILQVNGTEPTHLFSNGAPVETQEAIDRCLKVEATIFRRTGMKFGLLIKTPKSQLPAASPRKTEESKRELLKELMELEEELPRFIDECEERLGNDHDQRPPAVAAQ